MASAPKNICGEQIRKFRLEANMTAAELSQKIAMHGLVVDEAEIERIEAGESVITDLELIALSEIFSVSPVLLFPVAC